MKKTALITGITGQDGAYLTRWLLAQGYLVHGLKRRASQEKNERFELLDRLSALEQNGETSSREPSSKDSESVSQKRSDWPKILDALATGQFQTHYGDMTDSHSLFRLIEEIEPDEIYHLAAQSHVRVSIEKPEYTGDVNGLGTLRLLEAIRVLGLEKKTRFYQASTSELFGKTTGMQTEQTPFVPQSPYAVAKLYAYWSTVLYRQAYGFFACNGILFNHESPLRGENFVTQKVIQGVSRIQKGTQSTLKMGNIDSVRDWGHAADYVEGMWRMLQQETPDDYVLATGQTHTVREFIEKAFAHAGLALEWIGEGIDEKGVDRRSGRILVEIDSQFFRPADVNYLCGDATKARKRLGWTPCHTFDDLVQDMFKGAEVAMLSGRNIVD